jgi:ABC-type lipoprotein export system ATPase subunit
MRDKLVRLLLKSFNLLPFKNAAESAALPLYYQEVKRKACRG